MALIVIIAAIAVPSYVKARGAAMESSAIGTLKAMTTGSLMYYNNYNQYPAAAANLAGVVGTDPVSCATYEAIDPGIIANFGIPYKGYTINFTSLAPTVTQTVGPCTGTPGSSSFVVTAQPVDGNSGSRVLCETPSGVIHYDPVVSDGSPTTDVQCNALPAL